MGARLGLNHLPSLCLRTIHGSYADGLGANVEFAIDSRRPMGFEGWDRHRGMGNGKCHSAHRSGVLLFPLFLDEHVTCPLQIFQFRGAVTTRR